MVITNLKAPAGSEKDRMGVSVSACERLCVYACVYVCVCVDG